ncbi:MAG: hypothetical protein KH275_14945, partial [Clostridiales bacterium]|nr:hypothetical protein [Clostridiales bacterium]
RSSEASSAFFDSLSLISQAPPANDIRRSFEASSAFFDSLSLIISRNFKIFFTRNRKIFVVFYKKCQMLFRVILFFSFPLLLP